MASLLLAEWARHNSNFRRVVFTTPHAQWVLMSVPAGGQIGEETHGRVYQSFFFVSGTGKAIVDGVSERVRGGDTVRVPPGTTHNFINTGRHPLKLYTIYSPPNHIDGRIQKTKRAADLDKADEAFGRRVEQGRKKRTR